MLPFEQKRASTTVHVIINVQMLEINFNCYGVNKHTVPVRKMFSTVKYFFYGDTLSTNSSTCTTLLCYGSGIQRTAQYMYVFTLTTRTSIAMITWRSMYVILSKLLVLVFTRQSGHNELRAQCLRVLRYSVRIAMVSRYDSTQTTWNVGKLFF